MASTASPTKPDTTSLPERFFRYFQHEITALQEQMDRLKDTSLVGGERTDATDHCLAGISRLSSEVKDASSYIPSYDQRTYAEAIKALHSKLDSTRTAFAPRQRFAFKTSTSNTIRKNPSAISLNDAAEMARAGRRHIPGYRSDIDTSSADSSFPNTPAHRTPPNEPNDADKRQTGGAPPTTELGVPNLDDATSVRGGMLDPKSAAIRRPTFSTATSIAISNHSSVHIILPSSASRATSGGSLTNLKHCIVDMSVPTAHGAPFASLTVKSIKESLLVCGNVNGAAHITGVEGSVIVVSCHQFRMHECTDCDVYLASGSRPIIEDCRRVRFSQLPELYNLPTETPTPTQNLWSQVDDFKWIKEEHSPNWSITEPENVVPDEVWRDIVPGGPGWSLDDILRATRVLK